MNFGVPLGIAGVGLIGGSIALRARELGVPVVGFDARPVGPRFADDVASSLRDLASRVATLVIALPLDATLSAIDELRASEFRDLQLVMDVASVKEPVVARAAGWKIFAPTHPIAGAERGGSGAALAELFAGRTWAYVPGPPDRDLAVRGVIEAMGAHAVAVGAREHDEALALTSHLPQLVVSTLAALIEERGVSPELAGPGLASTLRLAGSPWGLWETIVRANAAPVAVALRDLAARLEAAAGELEAGEPVRIPSSFEGANRAYELYARASQEKGLRNS